MEAVLLGRQLRAQMNQQHCAGVMPLSASRPTASGRRCAGGREGAKDHAKDHYDQGYEHEASSQGTAGVKKSANVYDQALMDDQGGEAAPACWRLRPARQAYHFARCALGRWIGGSQFEGSGVPR
jgi:hypothetical protein